MCPQWTTENDDSNEVDMQLYHGTQYIDELVGARLPDGYASSTRPRASDEQVRRFDGEADVIRAMCLHIDLRVSPSALLWMANPRAIGLSAT